MSRVIFYEQNGNKLYLNHYIVLYNFIPDIGAYMTKKDN